MGSNSIPGLLAARRAPRRPTENPFLDGPLLVVVAAVMTLRLAVMLRVRPGLLQMVYQGLPLIGVEAVEEFHQGIADGVGVEPDLLNVLIDGLAHLGRIHITAFQALDEDLEVGLVGVSGTLPVLHHGPMNRFQPVVLIFIQLQILNQLLDGLVGAVIETEESERTAAVAVAVTAGQSHSTPKDEAQGDGQSDHPKDSPRGPTSRGCI